MEAALFLEFLSEFDAAIILSAGAWFFRELYRNNKQINTNERQVQRVKEDVENLADIVADIHDLRALKE